MTNFTVNGQPVRYSGEGRTHLADFLREEMGLTATHIGCEQGVCGACTLVKDGKPVRSCITYAAACEGAKIRTLEDYRDDALMARIRAAFKEHHGLQCGFCTPGMLATAYDIATRLPEADEARIREELAGNLCRCTGYMGIVAAIKAVLAEGPHVAPEPPAREAVIASARFGAAEAPEVVAEAAAASVVAERPAPLTDGHRLERVARIELPAETVWAVLSDIRQVADCMPGASVETVEGERVTGAMAAKIGPITARFGGTAFVTYEPAEMRGAVAGQGGDGSSRSTARGEVHFALAPSGDAGCDLTCEILYKLSGPLAQVGRPAIVAGVVDRLLADFTANVEAAARGEALTAAAPPGFARLILAALRNMVGRST
ncbi:xanthine dehydrogenase family Fe-S subunit [Vannielia sp. SX4]|uniref:xanthine dehydrogenase family Fe-S subunit n=1 Tax=Vannielia sp. SX4 TaxID=3463852 RepID=UPI00405A386F